MKDYVNRLFVLLSYGVINKGALRLRTKFIFMLFCQFILIGFILFVLGLLKVSEKVGGIALFISMGFPYLISKIIDPYVDNNWELFNYKSKEKIEHKWFKVIISWIIILGSVSILLLSIVWMMLNSR